MRNTLRRLGLPMVCVAMFSLLGGHWAIFQSIAWAQMLREYSRNATVAEAVEKTFSGEAPCPMCKSIAKEKQKEEKAPATVKVEKKGEIFLSASEDLLPAPPEWSFCYSPDHAFQVPVRCDSPPRPVPRASILLSV